MGINLAEGLSMAIFIQLMWIIKQVTKLNGTVKEIKRRCPLFKEEQDAD